MDLSTWIPILIIASSLVPGLVIFFVREESHRLRTLLNLVGAVAKLLLVAFMIWGVFHEQIFETRWTLAPGLDLVLLFWSACITSMTLLPSPGFVGTFDAAGLAALLVLGVASGPAGAAAVTLHVVMLLPVVVLGLGATLKVGVGLRSLVRER